MKKRDENTKIRMSNDTGPRQSMGGLRSTENDDENI
jgi:hypothetical protein